MMKKTLLLTLIATLPIMAQESTTRTDSPDAAEGRQIHRQRLINRFDVNKDGKLDEQETEAMQKFIAERNKNGKPTPDRHPAARQRPQKAERDELLKKYDKDQDGKLSDEERRAMREEMGRGAHRKGEQQGRPQRPDREELLKKYDKDQDGKLSDEERRAMREEMGRGAHRKGEQQGRPQRPDREELLKKYDKDQDGKLSDEERRAMREEMGRGAHGPRPEGARKRRPHAAPAKEAEAES